MITDPDAKFVFPSEYAELHRVERVVLQRLELHETVHLAAPERQAAAQRLARRGEVVVREGEGRDRGLLIVTRTAMQRLRGERP